MSFGIVSATAGAGLTKEFRVPEPHCCNIAQSEPKACAAQCSCAAEEQGIPVEYIPIACGVVVDLVVNHDFAL